MFTQVRFFIKQKTVLVNIAITHYRAKIWNHLHIAKYIFGYNYN